MRNPAGTPAASLQPRDDHRAALHPPARLLAVPCGFARRGHARLWTRAAALPINRRMKAFLATILLAGAAFALAGCETDVPPGPPRQQTGRVPGELTQPDRSDDPVIKENTRVGY